MELEDSHSLVPEIMLWGLQGGGVAVIIHRQGQLLVVLEGCAVEHDVLDALALGWDRSIS